MTWELKEKRNISETAVVMAEILHYHYHFYHHFGMLTHLTTNLNSIEIEKVYGLWVRSRLREICNLLAFPAEKVS